MRFGLFIPQGWRFDLVGIDPAEQWPVMLDLARRADAGPWESVWVYDHFHTTPVASDQATHEAWTLMAAFGAATERVRLGQMCTCMGYRNPAYLAKVAATVDHVSSGRIEMGIGGGWYEHEWRAYGYGFPPIADRLGMLREGVEIFRQAWTTGSATLHGRHYDVEGAIVEPRPLQGSIPMWIAGGGEKVTLKIAAEYADYTNWSPDPDEFSHKKAVLEEHCAALGRDPREITLSTNLNTIVGTDAADVAARIDRVEQRLRPFLGDRTDGIMREYRSGSGLVGTPSEVVARIEELRGRGLGYAIHYFPEAAYDRSGIELFENEVVPNLA